MMTNILLSGTVRRDGASVFDPAVRYGTFPSVTAGWRISQENFFKPITFINDLKLRGGWGKLGSINNIGATNAYTLYAAGAGYSYYPINWRPNNAATWVFTRASSATRQLPGNKILLPMWVLTPLY